MNIIPKADAIAHAMQAARGNFRSIGAMLDALVKGGINSELEQTAGTGITAGVGTIYRSAVQKVGGIIRTSILLDLTGLGVIATDLDIIGVGANPAHLGLITQARNGLILSGRMTCLEVPVGGSADLDLYYATEANGVLDGGVAALTEIALVTAGGAWTLALMKALAEPVGLIGKYLYLTNGAAANAGTFTAGKFLIELDGYDVNNG